MITNWINQKYLENPQQYQELFLNAKPFEHLSLDNFLTDDKANILLEEIRNLDYYLEDHDLYQFLRTIDFKEIKKNNTLIENLYEFIFSEEFIFFIEELTGTKISRKKGDLHSLKLLDTHYLLCHDDQVQGRYLAFIINLSDNMGLENGGALELFDEQNNRPKDIVKQVFPQFNQFNIFLVSDTSFHQISEVIDNVTRESISGWFYK